MAYAQFPIEEVGIEQLSLDVNNYRFPVNQPTENAAMNYLFAAHDVMAVAKIILRDGYIDNEIPLVVHEDGRYVILEGNRRLSALRALLEPSLVPAHQAELERMLRRYPVEAAELPTSVRVMNFSNREAAAPVLARLHIGESKKAWSLDEQAKFVIAQLSDGVNVEALKEQLPAVKDVVRLVRMGRVREMLAGLALSDPELGSYAASSKLAMSSFEYAYRNPDIQKAIGIAFDEEGNLTSRPTTELHTKALARLLRGFKNGELNTRRGLKTGTVELKQLLAEMNGQEPSPFESTPEDYSAPPASSMDSVLNTEGTPPAKLGSFHGSKSGESVGSSIAGGSVAPGQRGPNAPETKKFLDLTGIDEHNLPLQLKYRLRELRRIDVTAFPAAAAMLMRSVLEASIKEHYGAPLGQPVNGMLSMVMKQVTSDYSKNRHVAPAIHTVNQTGPQAGTKPGTGEWFNGIAHGVSISVEGAQAHAAWRAVVPLIRLLLNSPASSTQSE